VTFIYQNEALDECYPAVCLTQKTPTYDVSPIQARNELMQFNWRLYYGQRLLLHIWHQNNYFLLKTLPWKKMKNYSDFLKHTTDWKPFSCSYIKLLFLTVSPSRNGSDAFNGQYEKEKNGPYPLVDILQRTRSLGLTDGPPTASTRPRRSLLWRRCHRF